MDDIDNIFLLKLLKYKIKPNLSHYALDQLTNIYIELNDKKDTWLDKIQNILPENTTNYVKNIFNDIKNVNLNRKTETETENKKILTNWINDLWTKLPLLDHTNNIVECVICLNCINNNDCTIFKCNHMTHTTCFLNYLFSNLKNNSHIDTDVEKLFRCPNCRIFLTDMVKKSFGHNELTNELTNVSTNEYEADNESVPENNYYGDEYNNLILQEYNLVANTLDNRALNNVFRRSNNIGFGSNVIIEDENMTHLTNSSNFLSSSSLCSTDYSIYSISDED